MKIIIPTCDRYLKILEGKKYTMDKFGGANLDVTVLGFKEPKFNMGNWKFISLGTDTGPKSFTNDIYEYFKDFNDEYFIYGSDDVVVLDEINLDLFDEFKEIMDKNKDVVNIKMTPYCKNYYNGGKFTDNLIKTRQDADYRLSLSYGMWRTSYFMRYFELGLSPWEWELRDVAKNDGKIILGTLNKHAMDLGHLYRVGGKLRSTWHTSEITGKKLSDSDIEYLTKIIKI
jgi:hypothetical protein